MNSLLQTLYHTRALRQAVFNMPTGNDDQTTGVALAVQRVFFQLQTSDSAVETDRLTKSFGWESIDSFIQHDVQEFLRKLMDNLEEKMTGTPVDGVMAKLFKGSYKSFTRCVDVDYEVRSPLCLNVVQTPIFRCVDTLDGVDSLVLTTV